MSGRWPYGDDEWPEYDDSDPLVIDLEPGDPMQGKQAIVGKDPMLEEYLRSPYDPLYASMAMGRMTGLIVRRPPKRGWMRFLSYIVAFALIASGLVGTALSSDDRLFSYDQLRLGLISIPSVIAGVLLLWRLLRT